MLLTQKQGIDDLIVTELAKNPYSTVPVRLKRVQKHRPTTTKQAVYVALKALLASEAVSKVGSTYFLSRVWLGKINHLFETQKEKEADHDAVFDLGEKESISYHFPNLLTTDTYWAHIFDILLDWIPKETPIAVWMPHEWFAIGRIEVERNLFNEHIARQKFMCLTVGGMTALDKTFKREWENKYVPVHTTNQKLFPRRYYVHVFGGFLIEVFVAEELAKEIDVFYTQHETLGEAEIAFFEKLITERSPVRMKISRNKKKAAILRKRLMRDFYLPEGMRI